MNTLINFKNICIVEDNSTYSLSSFIGISNFSEYFNFDGNEMKPNFVGFIIGKENMIVSFPKKYGMSANSNEEILKLANLLIKFSGMLNDVQSGNKNENFPIDAYLNICNYYIKYGLYVKTNKTHFKGYGGKINWNQTFKHSDKLISNNNLLYVPFMLESTNHIDDFLTECMKEALHLGYDKFGKIFDVGIPYYYKSNSKIIDNHKFALAKLHLQYSKENNDLTKKLIISIIDFIKWLSNSGNHTVFLTKNFEYIWQNLVERMLNRHLVINYDNYNFSFDSYENNQFFREVHHSIQTNQIENTRNFSVRYDHLLINDKKALLFDSKYSSNEIHEFDYKQFAYYYTLKDYLYRNNYPDDLRIFNGLIYPTDKESYSYTHLNTISSGHYDIIRNIKIEEHYLNISKVIDLFLKE